MVPVPLCNTASLKRWITICALRCISLKRWNCKERRTLLHNTTNGQRVAPTFLPLDSTFKIMGPTFIGSFIFLLFEKITQVYLAKEDILVTTANDHREKDDGWTDTDGRTDGRRKWSDVTTAEKRSWNLTTTLPCLIDPLRWGGKTIVFGDLVWLEDWFGRAQYCMKICIQEWNTKRTLLKEHCSTKDGARERPAVKRVPKKVPS